MARRLLAPAAAATALGGETARGEATADAIIFCASRSFISSARSRRCRAASMLAVSSPSRRCDDHLAVCSAAVSPVRSVLPRLLRLARLAPLILLMELILLMPLVRLFLLPPEPTDEERGRPPSGVVTPLSPAPAPAPASAEGRAVSAMRLAATRFAMWLPDSPKGLMGTVVRGRWRRRTLLRDPPEPGVRVEPGESVRVGDGGGLGARRPLLQTSSLLRGGVHFTTVRSLAFPSSYSSS